MLANAGSGKVLECRTSKTPRADYGYGCTLQLDLTYERVNLWTMEEKDVKDLVSQSCPISFVGHSEDSRQCGLGSAS